MAITLRCSICGYRSDDHSEYYEHKCKECSPEEFEEIMRARITELEKKLSKIEVCWTCNCFVSDDDDICTLNSPRPCDRNGTCHSWRIKQIANMEKK